MTTTTERTISGNWLVIVGLVVTTVFVFGSTVLGPVLREDVQQLTSPRTLREPIETGETAAGQTWEAVAHFDGKANCLELRYGGKILDRACDDTDAGKPVRDITATHVPDGPVVAYGLAAEGVESVDVVIEAGTTISVPVKAAELGFPVGFWATALPEGESLYNVEPTVDIYDDP